MIDYTNCSLKDERAHKCGITPAAFFQHYFLPSKPVLLRGYARRYEAFRKWNPAYFLTRFGDIDVRVSEIPYGEASGSGFIDSGVAFALQSDWLTDQYSLIPSRS